MPHDRAAPRGFPATPSRQCRPRLGAAILAALLVSLIPLRATPIPVVNPSGEINGGVDREAIPSANIPGWQGTGQVINDRTLGGNGNWRLSFEDSQSLRQLTAHVITAGAAYSLRFDAAVFSGLPPSITADFYVDNSGTPLVVATRTFTLPVDNGVADWNGYQLLAAHGALDAHAGKRLGVQFRGPVSAALRYHSVDNVRLDTWATPPTGDAFTTDWTAIPNQYWLGRDFWANRLQDWEVSGGRAQVRIAPANRPYRIAHRLTTRMNEAPANFLLSVRTGLAGGTLAASFTGLLLGAGQDLDYRAAALVHQSSGKRGGLLCGIKGDGSAIVFDFRGTNVTVVAQGSVPGSGRPADCRIEVEGVWTAPDYVLTVRAYNGAGATVLSTASTVVSPDALLGSFGLCSHPGTSDARFWFNRFSGSGGKLETAPDRAFGPVLSTQYTLSRQVLKLTAQLAPLDIASTPAATLQLFNGSAWQDAGTSPIDPDAYTATFRLPGWNDTSNTPYRVRVQLPSGSGPVEHFRSGTITRDPVDTDELAVAGLTCMIHCGPGFSGIDQTDTFPWTRDRLFFPHELCATRVAQHQPHVLAFLGDQIYEGASPTTADNTSNLNRQLDYLYKWYLWCWTWGDLVRDRPSIALPDDHDVFQGNLWGEGGKSVTTQENGGYTRPAAFVKMVERTQTSHFPDPFDPTPVLQGIGVYYSPMVYGRIGMAILEDRKFKNGHADEGFGPLQPANPSYDTSILDKPGLNLLGARQEAFLEAWTSDWAGQDIKFVLSQTPFASSSTHSGEGLVRRYFDMDAGGWPQTARRRAIALMRKSFSFHLTGDQHVSLVFQHGITAARDAIYNFTVPSVANAFPRAWDPGNAADGSTSTVRPNLGDHVDGFGNPITMLATANPATYYNQSLNQSPADLHDRGPGYGIVRIRKSTRQFTFESWPLYANPAVPGSSMYPGWPVTRRQADNDGRTPAGYLPVVHTGDHHDAVVRVIDEQTGATVYALRIRGNRFRPPVYDAAHTHRVEILNGDSTTPARVLNAQAASAMASHRIHHFQPLHPCIIQGSSTRLGWDTEGAVSFSLNQGIGAVSNLTVHGVGFVSVAPTADTTYVLTTTAAGGGSLQTSTTVRVHAAIGTWKTQHFTGAELGNAALEATLWGDHADPDGDGLSNRMEYLMQSDPRVVSPTAFPGVEVVDASGQTFIQYTFPCLLEPSDERIVIESSPDLSNWTPIEVPEIQWLARTPSPGSTDRITFRHTAPVSALTQLDTRRYFRVRVE